MKCHAAAAGETFLGEGGGAGLWGCGGVLEIGDEKEIREKR